MVTLTTIWVVAFKDGVAAVSVSGFARSDTDAGGVGVEAAIFSPAEDTEIAGKRVTRAIARAKKNILSLNTVRSERVLSNAAMLL